MAEGFVDTNGVRLWYEELGDPAGSPVVLVMGATASALSWPPDMLDAFVAAGHRVIRFDNRDIGLSTHVDYERSPYTLDDMAGDTIGLMDALSVELAHFVGVSMGGMISQLVALRAPSRVRSLALVITSPGPMGDDLSPPSEEVFAIAARVAITPDEVSQRTVDLFRALTGSRFPFEEDVYREMAAADTARGTNPNSAHAIAVFSAPSRVADLAAVRVPAIVVHGTEDPILPYDHAEALAKAIPGATLVTWEGVGHELPTPLIPELTALLVSHFAGAG